MNANNYINWSLIKYATALSLLILFNYFLWSINSWQIIKFINLFIIFFTLIYFFVSSEFKDYWYLKVIILLLIIICLGTPTTSIDSWFVYLFSGKVLFYESNLYVNYLDDNYLNVNNRPKLPAALSATFAQLLGYWNEIFPKSTNVIIIFPPIIFLISFFKEKILILLWLFLMLFFSGKLFINGLMDGIISLYFVACVLITYKISITKLQYDKKLLYCVMLLFFMILSLSKDEGTFMIFAILFSVIVKDLIYKKKLNYKILVIGAVSLCPIFFWKYTFATTHNKFGAWLLTEDPISRISRIVNPEDLFNIFFYLITNEKLVISLIIFIFLAFKQFNNNRKLIFFISMNFILYFIFVIAGMLLAPHDVIDTLNASTARLFIPLVLMLSYFSVFLIKDNYPLEKT